MERKTHKLASVTLLLALAAICLLVFNFSYLPEDAHANEEETNTSDAFCRYGVAANGNEVNWISTFRAGWFLTFTRASAPAGNGAQFVPIIHLSQPKDENGNYLDGYESNPRVDITDPDNPQGLRYWLEQQPGALWIVGNEVDRGPNPGQVQSSQDDMQPDNYAEAYDDIYHYIKRYDPDAQVAISGLVQVTPSRLLYLDRFWDAYVQRYGHAPNVDAWTMHLYILPEVQPNGEPNGIASLAVGTFDRPELGKMQSYDPDGIGPLTPAATCHDPYDQVYCYAEHDNMAIFRQQVQDMRIWMKEHGQQNKPLLLSEYSLLYPFVDEDDNDPETCFLKDELGNCFTPDRVQTFMQSTFDYLESATDPNLGYPLDGHRLVQQWLWYSINSYPSLTGQSSNLVGHDDEGVLTGLTQVGEYFRDIMAGKTAEYNLVALRAHSAVTHTVPVSEGTGTASAPIAASFLSNSNAHITEPISVTFYSDAQLTNVIGTTTIAPSPGVLGCAQRDYTAGIVWNDLSPGIHRFWAQVQIGNDDPSFDETNDGDNVVSGRVLVDPAYQSRLPFVDR